MNYKELALNLGLPIDFAIKEIKLYELLSGLIKEGFDYPLVGGTAINKIYLKDEERFSEDLDFEVYGKRKIKLPQVEGFKIKGPYTYRRNVRFEAGYWIENKKDKIRVDINLKPKVKIKTVRKTISFMTGNTIVGVKTFTLEGLISRKLLAMKRRVEGKDFYDLWHSIDKIDTKELRKELKLLERIEKLREDWLKELIKKIEEVNPKELKKFNNYIPLERRPNWELVKNDVLSFIKKI